jgi:CheY-like chemotaxis protein
MTALARSGTSPWVLLVDDDRVAARGTARLLSGSLGARVSIVPTADSALRLVAGARDVPAAIVLDFDLGASSTGVELLMRLREGGFRGPCAFSTGTPAGASAALSGSRLPDDSPIFRKGDSDGGLVAWLGTALGEPGAHTSGVRRKAY